MTQGYVLVSGGTGELNLTRVLALDHLPLKTLDVSSVVFSALSLVDWNRNMSPLPTTLDLKVLWWMVDIFHFLLFYLRKIAFRTWLLCDYWKMAGWISSAVLSLRNGIEKAWRRASESEGGFRKKEGIKRRVGEIWNRTGQVASQQLRDGYCILAPSFPLGYDDFSHFSSFILLTFWKH